MNFRGLMNKKQKERNFAAPSLLRQRKGQGLSVNAIILIILGLVILVMMIIGFTIGWSGIKTFVSKDNSDTIVTACNIACSTNSQNNFCDTKREVTKDGVTLKDVTCNYLAKEQPTYKIENCGSISCDTIAFVKLSNQEILDSKCPGNEGKIVQALIGNTLQSFSCAAK